MNRLPIILASKSPRRKDILRQIGIPFKTIESNFAEVEKKTVKDNSEMKKLVIENAKGKALDVAKRIDKGVVIGVDTLVLLGTNILGKPKNEKEAYKMLTQLSGEKHKVYSGITLIKKENGIIQIKTASDISTIYFRKVSEKEILSYIKSGEPMDKAGGYAIQGKGSLFVKRFEGEYNSVVGLPVIKLLSLSKKLQTALF